MQYFQPSLSYCMSLKPLFHLFFEWSLKTGFTVIKLHIHVIAYNYMYFAIAHFAFYGLQVHVGTSKS